MFNGAIWLKGEFAIGEVQNHYPSGGVPQSFSATLLIRGKAKKGASYNIQISDAKIVFREGKGLAPPTIDRTTLIVPQPAEAFPFWHFALTQAPVKTHYIAYTIDGTLPDGKKGSWAFLQSTPKSYVKIGP